MKITRDESLEGWNAQRVIALDWHDGPIDGVCQFHAPAEAVWFSLLDERPTPNGMNDRLFTLSMLPPSSYALLTAALDFLEPNKELVWSPTWTPDGGAEWLEAERAVAKVESDKGDVFAIVRSEDLRFISGAWRVDSLSDAKDWFHSLGLRVPSSQARDRHPDK